MKKNITKGYAILGILFVLISVIAFAAPTVKTAVFWIAYAFTAIAFAAQIAIWKTTFGKEGTLKSKFLGLPVVYIGIVYLIVQIIAFAVFTAVPTLPAWSAILTCTVVFGISAVCMIAGEAGRNEIERVEAKVKKKVFITKNLQADVELLADVETDTETKAALKQLAEKIRYSDPVSCDELANLENEIADKIATLKSANDKVAESCEIVALLSERNSKCKVFK